eukprot:CAMPEP_0206147836 /NCGR_PEP_ID=MMETSP1473-20131121/34701_1 /ASSEMBLY_ACC=CAM_ASM_001109 /TAXON_ID=1461547 /ORGANISM="Stichococcus sp, Strain RCC1054" /LENGTH=601 /DNA_ID=CAMNT_0053544933 /DNA_START=60 /DNA_END=1868 /DNA_ORIENTATION=-
MALAQRPFAAAPTAMALPELQLAGEGLLAQNGAFSFPVVSLPKGPMSAVLEAFGDRPMTTAEFERLKQAQAQQQSSVTATAVATAAAAASGAVDTATAAVAPVAAAAVSDDGAAAAAVVAARVAIAVAAIPGLPCDRLITSAAEVLQATGMTLHIAISSHSAERQLQCMFGCTHRASIAQACSTAISTGTWPAGVAAALTCTQAFFTIAAASSGGGGAVDHDGEAADAAEAIARKERLEAEQREQQRVADEQKRLEEAEQRRQAQRQRRVELEEQARKAELLRIAEKAEAQKQAELKRQARQAQKAEQQRVEADERRRALEQRLTAQKAEAEQARLEKVRQEEEDALARSRSLQARLSSPASGQPHEASSHRSRSPTHSSDAEPCRGRKRGHDEVRREGSSREPSSSPTRHRSAHHHSPEASQQRPSSSRALERRQVIAGGETVAGTLPRHLSIRLGDRESLEPEKAAKKSKPKKEKKEKKHKHKKDRKRHKHDDGRGRSPNAELRAESLSPKRSFSPIPRRPAVRQASPARQPSPSPDHPKAEVLRVASPKGKANVSQDTHSTAMNELRIKPNRPLFTLALGDTAKGSKSKREKSSRSKR